MGGFIRGGVTETVFRYGGEKREQKSSQKGNEFSYEVIQQCPAVAEFLGLAMEVPDVPLVTKSPGGWPWKCLIAKTSMRSCVIGKRARSLTSLSPKLLTSRKGTIGSEEPW